MYTNLNIFTVKRKLHKIGNHFKIRYYYGIKASYTCGMGMCMDNKKIDKILCRVIIYTSHRYV